MKAPRLDRGLLRSLLILGSVVEARDAYTGGHLWRVSRYAGRLAERAGLEQGDVVLAEIGGFLHDLGKIGVPDEILRHPGALSEPQYQVIKTHPSVGADLLRPHPLADLALDAVTYHHERHDGRGYPARLAGEAVPLVARIVAIADAFDAMTSTRPYRRGMPTERAVAILREERGRQFDASLVDDFLDLAAGGGLGHILGHCEEGQRMASCPTCGPVIAVPRGLADGAEVPCRACGAALRLHRVGDRFECEPIGTADAAMLAPRAELGAVEAIMAAC